MNLNNFDLKKHTYSLSVLVFKHFYKKIKSDPILLNFVRTRLNLSDLKISSSSSLDNICDMIKEKLKDSDWSSFSLNSVVYDKCSNLLDNIADDIQRQWIKDWYHLNIKSNDSQTIFNKFRQNIETYRGIDFKEYMDEQFGGSPMDFISDAFSWNNVPPAIQWVQLAHCFEFLVPIELVDEIVKSGLILR